MSNTSEHLYTTGWRHLGVRAEEAWRVTKTMFLTPQCLKRDAFIHLSYYHLTSLHALACATWEDFYPGKYQQPWLWRTGGVWNKLRSCSFVHSELKLSMRLER